MLLGTRKQESVNYSCPRSASGWVVRTQPDIPQVVRSKGKKSTEGHQWCLRDCSLAVQGMDWGVRRRMDGDATKQRTAR